MASITMMVAGVRNGIVALKDPGNVVGLVSAYVKAGVCCPCQAGQVYEFDELTIVRRGTSAFEEMDERYEGRQAVHGDSAQCGFARALEVAAEGGMCEEDGQEPMRSRVGKDEEGR
jgi:hypothetical protein